jgi:exopolysaccharide biosynthesis protein
VTAGDVLKLSTATSPDLKGAPTALGGGPLLVHEGKPESTRDHKANQRHPRAAFGWNAKSYFFVVADGRQPGWSMGMSLPELAGYLAKLGCDEAMNLDGGGSVELWIEGRIVNRPCFGYERNTANALVLLRINPPSPP